MGVAFGQFARLQICRPLRVVAAERDGLGISPVIGVDAMTGDTPMLDAGAARVRAIGPVLGLPFVRAGNFVAGALVARPLLVLVRQPAGRLGRHAVVVAEALLRSRRIHAVHGPVLHALTARFRTLPNRQLLQ